MCFMSDQFRAILAPIDFALVPSAVKEGRSVAVPGDLTTDEKVAEFLARLLPVTKDVERGPVAALLPWVCDRLPSPHSRLAYASDLVTFVTQMRERGIDPLQVTGDDLRLYKAALLAAGQTRATVARALSVLRGTYQQFGKRGLIPWERVRDIQSIESPRVEKNTTPCLSQQEAIKLLHAPDTTTMTGLRDHAMLFVYFLCGRPHKKYTKSSAWSRSPVMVVVSGACKSLIASCWLKQGVVFFSTLGDSTD